MHNFPKGFNRIIVKTRLNKKQVKEILHLAIECNISFISDLITKPVDLEFPFLLFDGDDITQTRVIEKNDLVLSLQEFKTYMQGKGKQGTLFKEVLILNNKYKAEITKNEVKVGCQTFSHEIVKHLYELSQKAQKSKF